MKRSFPTGFALVLAVVTTAPWLEAQQTPPAAPPPQASVPTFSAQVEEVLVDVGGGGQEGRGHRRPSRRATSSVTEDGARADDHEVRARGPHRGPTDLQGSPVMRPVSSNQDRSERWVERSPALRRHQPRPAAWPYRAKAAVTEFLKSGVRDGDRVMLVSTLGLGMVDGPDAVGPGRDGRDPEAAGRPLHRSIRRRTGCPSTRPCASTSTATLRFRAREEAVRAVRGGAESGQEPVEHRPTYSTFDDPSGLDSSPGGLLPGPEPDSPDARHHARVSRRAWPSLRGRKSIVLISQGFVHDPSMA